MSLMLKFLTQQTKLNKTGANVEKQICGRGNRIYPDLVPNPIYSFRPFKGKFTKEGISASAKIDHCYNNISILALGISSIPDPVILTHIGLEMKTIILFKCPKSRIEKLRDKNKFITSAVQSV